MVQLIEYRIPMPLSVEEYQVGQLYGVAKMSEQETTGEEGVEVLKNEPYEKDAEKGQYTHKLYHLGSKMPGWVAAVCPKDLKCMDEEAYNAYPYCRTVISSPYFKEKFLIEIRSMHVPYNGEFNENVWGDRVKPEDLKKRQVEVLDITEKIDPAECPDDPTVYKSEKTGRGPLVAGEWQKKSDPMMCCYKLVTLKAQMMMVGGKIENFLVGYERKLFLKFHKSLFCWLDEFHSYSLEDIRKIEEETKEKMNAKIAAKKAEEAEKAAGKKK